MQITIPRWAQLVVIPIVALVTLYLLRVMSHAVFVFLMATLLSLLLNPIVLSLSALRIPRYIAVPVVYLSFATVVVLLGIIAVPPVLAQLRELVGLAPEWADQLDRWMTDIQEYMAARGVEVDLGQSGDRLVGWLEGSSLSTAGTLFDFTFNVVGSLATFFLVVIISFYMLFDGRRIYHYLRHMLPGDDEVMGRYLDGLQLSFIRYVKGQALLATSVGLAAGLGIWALGWEVIDIWPQGSQYVLLFGIWAGITEVLPYVGPWLGAAPPVALAFFHSPTAALWVALIFFTVQQLENHILVPNIMGTSVGVHPLVVIFALLAGAQIAGLLGMLAVLPLLAMLRHTLDFFDIRLSRAAWIGDDGMVATVPPRDAAGGATSPRAARLPDGGRDLGADSGGEAAPQPGGSEATQPQSSAGDPSPGQGDQGAERLPSATQAWRRR